MSAAGFDPELPPTAFDDSAISVVGMACRLPGAPDIATFWDLLAQGRDVISRFSEAELTAAGLTPDQCRAADYVPAKGVLQDADCFDAAFFGLAPSEAALMDPQQRVFIECAHSALEHAGYGGAPQGAQVGVFGGSILSMYLLSHLWPNKQVLDSAGVFSVAVGNDPTFLATRASYLLNLTGPSMSLGTACSTGLVAVHQACQSLLAQECDMALAGGVSIHLPLVSGYTYAPGSILSPDGACRPFDAAAAGTVSSDGCGVVTLKRLLDAQADGDTIHAVIRGSAVNNDGHEKVGFTAPSVVPQARVVAEAQEIGGTPPETIAMIEAHAAGTSVGDPVEVAALKEVFAKSQQPCAIGSVKSNIGHVDTASGIAGLIKTVLALQHRAIPPSVHFATPNPALELEQSCFYVPEQLTAHDATRGPMRAGVSSFGIGGTNCHVVLQEPPALADATSSDLSRSEHSGRPVQSGRPCHLIQLSARTTDALEQMALELATALEQPDAPPLADVAHTLRCGRSARDQRLALVAASTADAVAQLRKPVEARPATPQRLAFMFPGLGDHYTAMGWELYCLEPSYRDQIDTCAKELAQHRRGDIRDQLFPDKDWRHASARSIGAESATGKLDMRAMLGRSNNTPQPDPLEDPINGQVAIFVTEYALAQLLQSWGLRPAALTGYSIGEFVAACIARIVSLKDALRIVAARAALIRDLARKGGMMAVPLGEAEVQDMLSLEQRNSLSLAAANGPRMSILSGPDTALKALADHLQAQGHSCQRLGSAYAYHSTMMDDIVPALSKIISTVPLSAPSIPCVSCVTGDWLSVQEATDPGYWAAHLSQTVRFRDAVATLLSQDGLALAEVGPGQSLSSHARAACNAMGCKTPVNPLMKWSYSQQSEYRTLLQGMAALWAGGAEVDAERLLADPTARRVPLPTYPFARQRHWVDAPQTGPAVADPTVAGPVAAGAASLSGATSPLSGATRKPVEDWTLAPSWKPAPLPSNARPAQAHYVVLMDGSEAGSATGSALLDALRTAGAKATAFWPDATCAVSRDKNCPTVADRDAFAALITSLAVEPDLPLHFLHLDLLSDYADFETTQAHGYHSVVALLQAITLSRLDEARLTVVAAGLSDPGQDGRLNPDKVPVLGALKVARQERPGLTTQALDLDSQVPAQIARRVMANLAQPRDAAQNAPLVAYRRGRRLVETLMPLALPVPAVSIPAVSAPALSGPSDKGPSVSDAPVSDAGVIRTNGTYVITGGLGGVGLALAHALVAVAPVRLALLGRNPLDQTLTTQQLKALDPTDPSRRRIEALRALRQAGAQVLTLAADVADVTAMQAAFARIETHFGPIHGVFHCAGAIDANTFCEIASETRQNADRQFHAKVQGTQVLAGLLKHREADFCVLMSSLAAQLGGLGFSAYAAANLYLDAFAEAQSAGGQSCGGQYAVGETQSGARKTRWVSINWDAWQLGEVKSAVKGFGTTVSSYFMEPEAACSLLLRTLAQHDLPRVIVSTGDLEQRMAQWLHHAAQPAILRQNRPDAPRNLAVAQTPTQEILVEIWQDLFALEPIGIDENFFALGGHSLLATQLNARIASRLDVDLSLAAVLNSPSIAELAEKIDLAALDMADPQMLDGLLSELDGLSDAELSALLEQEGSA